jgi:hypothetical protein
MSITETGIKGIINLVAEANFLKEALGGKILRIDPEVMAILGDVACRVSNLKYEVLRADLGTEEEDVMDRVGGVSRETILSAIAAIDSPRGAEAFQIAPFEDEMEMVIGYHGNRAVYLEHEKEEGEPEQYHLHMRDAEKVGRPWRRSILLFITG